MDKQQVAEQYAQEILGFKADFRQDVQEFINNFFAMREEDYTSENPDMNGEDVWSEEYAFDRDDAFADFMRYMDERLDGQWRD